MYFIYLDRVTMQVKSKGRELMAGDDVHLVSTSRGDQPAEDASLEHQKPLGNWWNTGQTSWEARHL